MTREFDELVTCLLVQEQHRIPVARLVARVRELAVAGSDGMPPVCVLYNGCHGGFGFSVAFERFSSIVGSGRASRACDADAHTTLKRFARSMLARFPAFDRHMRAFHKYRLGEVMTAVKDLGESARARPDLVRKVAYVERLLETTDRALSGTETEIPSDRVLRFCADSYLDCFDDAQLREILALLRAHIARTDAGEYANADLLDPAALRSCERFQRERERAGGDDEAGDALSFADQLAETGEFCWDRQRFFSKADMQFTAWLLLRSEPAQWIELGDYDLEGQVFDYSPGFFQKHGMREQDALEFVGRMLASGAWCRLSVADVPALSDWRIGAYDGLESVAWD
jgi:hypothetical protein